MSCPSVLTQWLERILATEHRDGAMVHDSQCQEAPMRVLQAVRAMNGLASIKGRTHVKGELTRPAAEVVPVRHGCEFSCSCEKNFEAVGRVES